MAQKLIYDVGFNVDASNLDKLKQQLSTLGQYKMNDLLKINTSATEADLQSLQKSVAAVSNALNQSYNLKLDSTNIQSFNQHLSKSGVSIQQIAKDFGRAGVQGQIAFRNLATDLMTSNTQLKQTHSLLDSMATTLGNTIKWSIASGAINGITSSVKKAWSFTKALDESLTNIRIVTGQSAEEMERFAKQANKAAKDLGTATTSYTNAALIFYQQGLGDKDVAARTEATIKAANVTGQSAAEVSEQLTAVWNGYKVVAEEAELYVDRLAAVAATTAADLEELSTGMSKVASAANAMGVNVDQLSAQLSTIISVTRQDANVVGTALKTIYSRMGDLKVDGVDEFGVTLGDVSGQLQQMGINVLDQEGNLREMGTVIEDVAKKWGTWTDAQQQAAAVAIAGKRQYNNLIALFENWNMYESALTTSQSSAGTLQKQQDTYIDSLEGKLAQLSATGDKVYQSLFNSDSMKDLIDALTTGTELLAGFIDHIGGGGQLLANFGAIAMTVFRKQLSGGIATAITNLTSFHSNTIAIAGELRMVEQQRLIAEQGEVPLLNNLVDAKRQQLNYARVLTAEQKQQWDQQIQMLNTTQNEVALAEEKEKNVKEELQAAQELLKTKKILTTTKGPEAKADNLRAGEALTGSEFRERKNAAADPRFYTAGSVTEFKEFNLDAQEGRDAALKAIEFRDNDLKEQEKSVEKTLGIINTTGEDSAVKEAAIGTYAEDIDSFTQGYAGNPEDITELISLNEQLVDAQNEYNVAKQEALTITKTLNAEEEKLKNLKESGASDTAIAEQEAIVLEKRAQATAVNVKEQQSMNSMNSVARKVAQEHTKILQQNRQELDKVSKTIKDYKTNTDKAAAATENAKIKLSNAKAEMQRFVKSIKVKAIADGIVGVVGGLSQIASALSTLTNLPNIFNDDSLSGWEKMLAIVQNLGMALPMLVGGAGSVITVIKSLVTATQAASLAGQKQLLLQQIANKESAKTILASQSQALAEKLKRQSLEEVVNSLSKEELAQFKANLQAKQAAGDNILQAATEEAKGKAGENAGNKLFFAGLKAQLGFWPLLVIGLAIAAVLATIVATIAIFSNKAPTALEKAQKNLEQQQETLNQLNEQYKTLTDRLNSVSDAFDKLAKNRDVLNDLMVGSEEWTKALRENNQEVMNLIQQYPELAQYMKKDSNGVLSISQEGQDLFIEKTEATVNKNSAMQMAQQIEVLKAENEVAMHSSALDTYIDKDNLWLTGSLWKAGYDNILQNDSLSTEDKFKKMEWLYGGGSRYQSIENIIDTEDMGRLADILSDPANQTFEGLSKALNENKDILKDSTYNTDLLAQALLEDKESTYTLVTQIEANNKAMEQLRLAYIGQKYVDDKDRGAAKSTQAWDAYMAATEDEIQTSFTNAYGKNAGEDRYISYTTSTGETENYKILDTADHWGAYLGKEANDLLNEKIYKAQGLTLKAVGDNSKDNAYRMVTVDESGKETVVDSDVLLKQFYELVSEMSMNGEISGVAINGDKVQAGSANTKANVTKFVNSMYNAIQDSGASAELANLIGVSSISFSDNNVINSIDRDALKKAQQAQADALNLDLNTDSGKEEFAKAMKYDSWEDYQRAFEETVENAEETVKNITAGNLNRVFNTNNFKDQTVAQARVISDAYENVFTQIGTKSTQKFDNFIQSFNSPETRAQVAEIAQSINWTDVNAQDKFLAQLREAGIIVNENSDEWIKLVGQIKKAADAANNLAANFDQVRKIMTDIKSIAGELATGDVISEEDYKTLMASAPGAADQFIQTVDGYQFIGQSGTNLQQKATEDFTYEKIKAQNNNINRAASWGSKLINDDQLNISSSDIKNAQSLASILGVLNPYGGLSGPENMSGYVKILLQAQGLDPEAIYNNLKPLFMPGYDQATIDAAGTTVKNALQAIKTTMDESEAGKYSDAAAAETVISYNADNWNETKIELGKAGYDSSTETYKKFETQYKNQYLQQLGFEGWDIAEALDIDTLEDYVENMHKLELDYLADTEQKINKLEAETDRLWGKERLNNLQQLISLQDEYAKDSQEVADWAQQAVNDNQALIETAYGEKDFKNTFYNNGVLDADKINDEIKRLRTLGDEESVKQAEELQAWLDSMDVAAEKSLEAMEAAYKVIDLQIQKFNEEIEIRLNLEQAKRDWLEFVQENLSTVRTGLNFFIEAGAIETVNNLLSMIPQDLNSMSSALEDLRKFKFEEKDGVTSLQFDPATYKDLEIEITNEAALNEAFATSYENALSAYEQLKDTVTELYDQYEVAQNELMELYDEQINRLNNINSILQNQADLLKIVKQNSKINIENNNVSEYYKTIVTNADKAYNFANDKLVKAQEEYEKALNTKNKELIAIAEENLNTAASEVTTALQDKMSAIAEFYGQKLSEIMDSAVMKATEGLDLSDISEEWELATKKEERYLDAVEEVYALDELERKYQKSINETDNLSAQNKINQAMKVELEMLKNKDKLSQYDLDRANAKYELTLKQIALEEAQQNATKMQLTRDALGNYTYQYVADQDSIAQAEEELAAAEKALYDMDKERNQSLVDEYYATMTEANAAIQEAMLAGDTERAQRLKEHYYGENGLLAGIQNELGIAATNLDNMGDIMMNGDFTSGLEEWTDQIEHMDLTALRTEIDNLFNGTDGDKGFVAKIGEVYSAIINDTNTGLLNGLSSITTVMGGQVEELATIHTEANNIAATVNSIITNVTALVPVLEGHAKELSTYAASYIKWTESQMGKEQTTFETALNDNQTATERNTVALLNMIDALHDQKIDGKNGDTQLSFINYQFNKSDESWQYYDQAANEVEQ